MPSYRAFRQIKIRHIFIMQFGGYFVKFYSRQIFRPYGIASTQNYTGAYIIMGVEKQLCKQIMSLKTANIFVQLLVDVQLIIRT